MCEVIGAIEGKVLPDDTMVRARGKSDYDTCLGGNSMSNGNGMHHPCRRRRGPAGW